MECNNCSNKITKYDKNCPECGAVNVNYVNFGNEEIQEKQVIHYTETSNNTESELLSKLSGFKNVSLFLGVFLMLFFPIIGFVFIVIYGVVSKNTEKKEKTDTSIVKVMSLIIFFSVIVTIVCAGIVFYVAKDASSEETSKTNSIQNITGSWNNMSTSLKLDEREYEICSYVFNDQCIKGYYYYYEGININGQTQKESNNGEKYYTLHLEYPYYNYELIGDYISEQANMTIDANTQSYVILDFPENNKTLYLVKE